MNSYKQLDFRGGIRADVDATKLGNNEYSLGINVRTRNNTVAPIKKPRKQSAPEGLKQGLYGVDRFLVMFNNGQAFVYDTARTDAGFYNVPGFQMSATEAEIHFIVVPGSAFNFAREDAAGTYDNRTIGKSGAVGLAFDGVTQPHVIFPFEGGVTARPAGTYSAWSMGTYSDATKTYEGDNREYVPIGKYPLWTGERLYLAGQDSNGNYTIIYRSVTGRPLDFVVNILSDGNKGGDASTTAHYVSGESITALMPSPSVDVAFIASTLRETYQVLVVDDLELRRFNEPVFRNRTLFQGGCVGHFANTSVAGNTTLITQTGIHSFNAVAQLQYESKNEPLTSGIARYLKPRQTAGAAYTSDDYGYYAVDTVYGPAVLVLDSTTAAFVSMDIYRGVGRIKQFAETVDRGQRRLWFITEDGGLYEAFAAAEHETAHFLFGDITAASATRTVVSASLAAAFREISGNVKLTARLYADRREAEVCYRTITGSETPTAEPVPVPFHTGMANRHTNVVFTSSMGNSCAALSWMLSWQGAAELSSIEAFSETSTANIEQQKEYKNLVVTAETFAFLASIEQAAVAAFVPVLGALKPTRVILGGDFGYESGAASDVRAALSAWPAGFNITSALGDVELSTANGSGWLGVASPRRFFSVRTQFVEFFILNGGYAAADVNTFDAARDTGAPVFANEPSGNDADSQQAKWFRKAVAASTALFKVVVIHEPPYSGALSVYPGYKRLRWCTEGVDLVLSGHARNYERYYINGRACINCGSATDTEAFYPLPFANSQYRDADHTGFLKITADHMRLTTEFVDSTGATSYDKYTINA